MRRVLRSGRRRVVAVAAVVVLVGAGTGGWVLTRGDEAAAQVTSTTATVALETIEDTVAVSGTIAAADSADLDFAVSGTVTEVLVEAGDTVRRGTPLARVDDTSLVASRTAARSTYDAAVTQLDEDEDADASDVQIAADQTAVVSARDALASAREAVDDATLVSTIRGTVTSVGIEVGDTVGSSGGSSAGASGSAATSTATTTSSTTAVSIVSTGTFVLDATVAAADVESLQDGLQAELTVSGVTDAVYGTVTSVGRVAETSSSGSAVFPVTVTVTGTRDDLYSGTSADATITVSQTPDVLTVSTPAVQTDGDTTYVDLVTDEATGATTRTEIEIGETYGMSTEVVSGLSEGDVVSVPGFARTGGGEGGGGQQMELPEGFTPPEGGFPGGGAGGFGGGAP